MTQQGKGRAAEFDIGYDAAVQSILYFLRFVDWQEDTAADAVEAHFCLDAETSTGAGDRS